jgi:hypothetical protein
MLAGTPASGSDSDSNSGMTSSRKDGRLVWIPDRERVWVQARLLESQGGQAKVCVIATGRNQAIDVSSVAQVADEEGGKGNHPVSGQNEASTGRDVALPFCNTFLGPTGLEDMTNLDHLHEPVRCG